MIKTENGHCWVSFDNGYTISMFNGFGSYTENHFNYGVAKENFSESETVEVAVLYDGGIFATPKFIDCGDDEVKGHLTMEELADLIYKVKNYKE